jgi:hypothetical protein
LGGIAVTKRASRLRWGAFNSAICSWQYIYPEISQIFENNGINEKFVSGETVLPG